MSIEKKQFCKITGNNVILLIKNLQNNILTTSLRDV